MNPVKKVRPNPPAADVPTIDDGSETEVVVLERRWLTRLIGVAIVSSAAVYFVFWLGLILATNNLDPAYVLAIPDALLMSIGSAIIGFTVGLLVALSGGVTGRLILTVGLIGAGIYVAPIAMIPVELGWFGVTITLAALVAGCVLATRWAYLKTHAIPHQDQNEPEILDG